MRASNYINYDIARAPCGLITMTRKFTSAIVLCDAVTCGGRFFWKEMWKKEARSERTEQAPQQNLTLN
jgi:hypothetical protein